MIDNYHAIIINLSQIDKSIFKQFNVIDIRKRFLSIIKLYKITVPKEDI